jgi:hypothetical protein
MRITDASGQVLELEVLGYQFPDHRSKQETREKAIAGGLIGRPSAERWDANWLVIRGYVQTSRGSWKFEDPCLETWEARSLCDCLTRVAAGEPNERLDFIEPNLAFNVASPRNDAQLVGVVVEFGLEARPPWSSPEVFEQSPVNFDFRRTDLAQAAADLAGELDRYPER